MRNKRDLNNILSTDRKTLYIVLSIVMVSVLTLTVVYAALSTTLQINGQAQVTAASWDVYLDNVQLNSQSATTALPTISNKTTASFSTTLSKPGDFYEFTIDVVNNGSIDAMIDSVTRTPTLTEAQAKYLNYIVEYQNGEAITTKQLVAKNSYVRLLVKVEFRKDITASDLPTTSETLNLSFTVNYVQRDETGTNVTDNGVAKKAYEIISGDIETVGSEVAIGDEHFYVISSDAESVTMLAKSNITTETTPKQSTSAPTVAFSSTNYWYSGGLKAEYGTSYPAYVYDSNSSIYNYVENYRIYLESQGAEIEEARLIKIEELESLGCSMDDYSCSEAPEWVYSTSYWSGAAYDGDIVLSVDSLGVFDLAPYGIDSYICVRPVITLTL